MSCVTMFPSIAVLMKAAAWTSAGLHVLKNSCRASWLSLNSRKFLYVPKASQSLTLALPPSLTLATTGHLAGQTVDHTPQRQLDRRALNDSLLRSGIVTVVVSQSGCYKCHATCRPAARVAVGKRTVKVPFFGDGRQPPRKARHLPAIYSYRRQSSHIRLWSVEVFEKK